MTLVMLLSDLAPFCYHYFQGVVTFGWLTRVLHMGNTKTKIAKRGKEYFLRKGTNVMYILYFKSY